MKILRLFCLLNIFAFSALAQRSLDDGVKDLADQLRRAVAASRNVRVAVLPLRELANSESVLGTYLAEELTTRLFTPGVIQIVERQQLDRIMTELKMQQSGAIDPATAKRVGQLTGADAIVTGTVTEFQSFVALNCRIIETQDGSVLGTGAAKILKDDDLKSVLARPLGKNSVPQRAASSTAVPLKIVRMSYEFANPVCHTRGDQITCKLTITNLAESPRYTAIHIANISGTARSYLIDSAGKRYPAWSTQVAGVAQFMFESRAELQPGLPAEAIISFKIPDDLVAPKTAAMCVYIESEDTTTVIFKDVSIE